MAWSNTVSKVLCACIGMLCMRLAFAGSPWVNDWRTLGPYGSRLMEAATATDEPALIAVERIARTDASANGRAYTLLAQALRARMHFDFVGADAKASRCMSIAEQGAMDGPLALCGWLRMNIAGLRGDYPAMAALAGRLAAANRRLMQQAGLSDDDVAHEPALSFLRGPESYRGVLDRKPPRVVFVRDEHVPVRRNASGELMVNVHANGVRMDFNLDTGAGPTVISHKVASAIGAQITPRKEVIMDILGHPAEVRRAYIRFLSVGSFTVRDFPVLVDGDDASAPLLGMDFLKLMGAFTLTDDTLVVGSSNHACHDNALLRSAVFPDPMLVLLPLETSDGVFHALLDTGAARIYAMSPWSLRSRFGIKDAETRFSVEGLATASGGGGLAFYFPTEMSITEGGNSLHRELRLYTNLSLNTDLTLGLPALRDFVFSYDLQRGVGCVQPRSMH